MSERCKICGGASTCPAGLYKRVREVEEGELRVFPQWQDVPPGWKVTHAKKRGYYALPVQVGEWELVVVGTAQASRVRAHYGISPRWVGQCRYAFYAVPAAPGEVLYGLVWRRRWVADPFEEPLPRGVRPVAVDPVGRWLVLCNRCGPWAWRGIAPAEGRGPCLRCGLGEAVFHPFPDDHPFPPLSERWQTMRHVIIRPQPLVHGWTLCPTCGTAPALVAVGEEAAKCLRCEQEAPFVSQEGRHG